MGYRMFILWYKIAMGHPRDKTYDEFSKSQYYTAFVRFGTYLINVRAISPNAYVEWLIENKIKLERWNKDTQYNKFLRDFSKQETAARALERFVLHTSKWESETGNAWHTFWDKANMNRIIDDITNGKISPWILFSSSNAQQFIDTVPSDLLPLIANSMDIDFWQRKVSLNKHDVTWINEVIG